MQNTLTTSPVPWLDDLLYDVADRVQLSATDYRTAQDHYRAVSSWISSPDSEIAQYSPYVYPQGSFRIQATTAAFSDEDDYDIDCMLEMNISHGADPEKVLDAVFRAIDRGPNTRYHGKVEVKKRCVRVKYPRMHLDLTPAVYLGNGNPRESIIFDTHPDRPGHAIANPEGFSQWFNQRILPQELLNERVRIAKADAAPVPDQQPLEHKPTRLLALQLIKRFRDVVYADRPKEKPPSVVLAYLVANASSDRGSLIDTLTATVSMMWMTMRGPLLWIPNPRSVDDMLTDRWPANPSAQVAFASHLDRLQRGLIELKGPGSMVDKQAILQGLFGERVANFAFEKMQTRVKSSSTGGGLKILGGTGGLILPSVKVSNAEPVKPHTFYGDSEQ